MSNQPRRSLRIRSSNVSKDSMDTDKIQEADSLKIRVPIVSKSMTKNEKTKGKTLANTSSDDIVNDNDSEEENQLIMEKKIRTRQLKKRGVTIEEEKEEAEEEEEASKEEVPTKTRRIEPKKEGKEAEISKPKMEIKAATIVESKGRPRRGCVRRTTVEQYDDLMSGSASSSDATSSESDVEDSDLEKEIKKAKKRRVGRNVTGKKEEVSTDDSSSDTFSEDDEKEDEDEEDELSCEEKVNKKGHSRGPFSSVNGRCNRKGVKSGNKRWNKSKKEMNELPLQIRHDREYAVDYDEMVAWEAKSVKMVRDLRELERERANGGQIMDTVNEFTQRCLKDGRMTEMDEKESIRLTHIHETELAEMNRKKKLSVAQRMKEQVEREQRLEESGEDEEEDEWEEMELVDEREEKENKEVEVRIETMKKLNAPWKAKWIRQEVNREVRQRCENIHKAHLISYISHMRHLMALAQSTIRNDEGVPLSVRALSMLPSCLMDMGKKSGDGGETNVMVVEELTNWWKNTFTKVGEKKDGLSEIERLEELMEHCKFDTSRDAVVLFSSFASHLNLPLRIVARCEVVTKKPKENTHVSKKGTTFKNKKADKNTKEENPRKEKSIAYWCEIWNDVEKTWKVFDPFLQSCETEEKMESTKGNKKIKKNKEKMNEMEIISDFVRSWNSSTHIESLHSCMEKNGVVLYFIAVDNQLCVRDVSRRYINGKDLISREFRGRRANEEWLIELWENKSWAVKESKVKEEEREWMDKIEKMGIPKTVAAFKDHPLYILDKDVLKMQIIFPYDMNPIGEIMRYKIYLRKFVRPINTPKWYEKMGRQIKKDESPCGEKQVTNPISGETGTQGLYGYWQTEGWDGGEVVEGRIPRNEFGNVYMYQPEMVPRGCIYLVPEGLQRVAMEEGKDFVPAVIAWYYKGGSTIPLIRGAVFIKEDLPDLLVAWKVSYKRWKEEERKERTDRCMRRWKKLIKGMMRLAAMRKEFEPIEKKKKTVEKGVEEEETSWPQKKYGGEIFE